MRRFAGGWVRAWGKGSSSSILKCGRKISLLRYIPRGHRDDRDLLNMAVALTVSKRTPAPPDDVQRIIEQIRAPNHPGPPLDI